MPKWVWLIVGGVVLFAVLLVVWGWANSLQ